MTSTTNGRHAVIVTGLTVLFLVPRLALLLARDPFFDELFTRWISAKSFSGIIAALHFDSGPPLYYFLVHLLGNPPLPVLRGISLLFALGAFLLVLLTRRAGNANYWAAALLAVYPPAVLLSVDARAYAMCAFFVALGILALDSDRPMAAAFAFIVGAYCHYYGVLFFPLLLLRGRRGLAAATLAGVAYAPGILLAMHQPQAATAWNEFAPWRALTNLSFSGVYPSLLLLQPPALVTVIALILLVLTIARSWRFALYVLVPVGLTLLFAAAGRRIYFPLRFESLIAMPLMLWAGDSLLRWPRQARVALASALMVIGVAVISFGVTDHMRRPLDGCLTGALFIRERVPPQVPVVAGAYCYLFSQGILGDRVTAFPAEQALHPGWWRPMSEAEERPALQVLPKGEFVWLGRTLLPETSLIMRNRTIREVVAIDENTRVLRVAGDTLH